MPPAARLSDAAIPAHPGILTGPCSPDVTIGFFPAARMSDPFACGLPPTAGPHFANSIITGSASVQINFHPAARIGDALACGSTIATGFPAVNIGGPTFGNSVVKFGPITIRGSPAFIRRVTLQLLRLMWLPDGRRLLSSLTDVTFVEYTGLNSYAVPLDMAGAYGGKGSAAVVGYNPNLTLQVWSLTTGTAPTPPHLVAGHELIHSLHFNNATTQPNDEAQTIGPAFFPGLSAPSPGNPPTENSLRWQSGPALGQRVGHGGAALGRDPLAPPGPVQ